MNDTESCSPADDALREPRLLAHGHVGQVALCGCGHLHLNLQYLTLRFEPDAFRELAALVAFAQRRLDAESPARTAPASPGSCPLTH